MTAKAGPEMHRDPQGDRAGGARRCGRAGDQGGAREGRRRRSAARSRCAWVRSQRSRSVARCSGRIAELRREAELRDRGAETLRTGGRGSREGRIRRAGAAVSVASRRRPKRCTRSKRSGRCARSCRMRPMSEAIAYARGGEGSLVGSVFTADDDAGGRARARSRAASRPTAGRQSRLRARNRPVTVRRCPGWCTAVRAAPAVAKRWAAFAASCTTCSAPRCRAVRRRRADHRTLDARRAPEGARRASVPQVVPRAADRRHAEHRRSAKSRSTTSRASPRCRGDTFYAHMDEEAARRNPLFGGRVAHGYFLISAAAGLFVDPPYGPVLANYGIDRPALREAGQAGRPHQGAADLQVEVTARREGLRRSRVGHGDHQPERRDRRAATTC